ncbi:MAG: glycosyltransferase family 2 protein [Roseburia sp.]|nr:glycosyltransferase family 2 protein [Roseburia sp.]
MKNVKISVIIPVYNVIDFLKECLGSVLNQTYKNLEIILVDDGSTDGSSQICDEYKKKDRRIQVIHKENGGLSDARNAGIKIAQGEYFSFIDSDDWIHEDTYRILADKIKQNHADIICFGMIELYENKRNTLYLPQSAEIVNTEEALKRLMIGTNCGPSVCNKLFKRSMFENIQFPVGKISEDIAVIYNIFDHAHQVEFINESFYYYRHRSNSITTAPYSIKNLVIVDYAKDMICYMREKHPALVGYAQTYYANTLISVSSRILALNNKEKKLYKQKLSEYKKELRKYRKFLRTTTEKIKYLLIKTNMYGLILNTIVKLRRKYF